MHHAFYLGHDVLWRVRDPISQWIWAYHNGYGIPITWPKLKPLGTWHWNAESTLQRNIAPHQGSILGLLGLWAGAVGSCQLSTHGYHFIIVSFILNAHYSPMQECDVSHSPLFTRPSPWPKHKSLEAWHWNAERLLLTSLLLSLYSILTIYCVLLCMSIGGGLGIPFPAIYAAWSLTLKCWNALKCTMEKNHLSLSFIKDRSRDCCVSGWVLWGPVIPAPVIITSLLLSLYSILTIYCVPLCMSVMHDALGMVTNHWKLEIFPHYLLCPTLYECNAWCIRGGLGIPYPAIYLGHDVLWRVGDPISQWMMAPDPSTNHWEPGVQML